MRHAVITTMAVLAVCASLAWADTSPRPGALGLVNEGTGQPAPAAQVAATTQTHGASRSVINHGSFGGPPYALVDANAVQYYKDEAAEIAAGGYVSDYEYKTLEATLISFDNHSTYVTDRGGCIYIQTVVTGLQAGDIVEVDNNSFYDDGTGYYSFWDQAPYWVLINPYTHNTLQTINNWIIYFFDDGSGNYTMVIGSGQYDLALNTDDLTTVISDQFRLTRDVKVWTGATLVNPVTSSRGYICSTTGITGGTVANSATLDQTDMRYVGVAETWVDDAWVAEDNGDIVDGHVYGQEAFKTVKRGMDGVLTDGVVHVAAGTYAERVMITKSLDLRGAQYGVDPTQPGARTDTGAEAIITEEGLSTPNPDVLIEIPTGVTNVTVDGFTLHGDLTNTTADTCVVRSWDDFITVSNNIMDGRTGVVLKGGDALDIVSNRITSNGTSIVVQPNPATDVNIEGNTLAPGAAPAADTKAIYLTGVTGATIADNTASGFPWDALAGNGNTQVQITGNTFTGCRKGISLWGTTTDVAISDNVLSGHSQHGIEVKGQDITISENTVTGNGGAGVCVDKHTLDTTNVSLRHNDLSGNTTYGLVVTAAVTMQVDAEENYWGSVDPTIVAGEVSGNGDYTPWCNDDFTDCELGLRVHNITQGTNHATIQEAIDAATAGDEIHADAGTYSEAVVIDRSVTLIGDSGSPDTVGPGTNAPVLDGSSFSGQAAFDITTGTTHVTIKGFVIQNYGPDDSTGADGVVAWNSGTSYITVQHNRFENLGWNAVLVGNDGATGDHTFWDINHNLVNACYAYGLELTNSSHSVIADNIVTAGTKAPFAGIMTVARRNEADITIQRNEVTGPMQASIWVMAWDKELTTPALTTVLIENNTVMNTRTEWMNLALLVYPLGGTVSDVTVHGNSLVADASGYAFANYGATVIDASGNWWGSNSAGAVADTTSSNVDYTPWLHTATDTASDPGFQGDFSTLWVDDDSPQTGTIGRIQEGVNLVSGSTVNVAAGTYNETVTVNKKLTLAGAGSGVTDTVITPPSGSSIVISASGASPSDRLTVQDLRVTGAPAHGIEITAPNASYLTFDNVACVGNGSRGINTNPPTGSGNFADFVLTDCDLSSNTTGLRFASYVGINGLAIDAGHMDSNVCGLEAYTGAGWPLLTNVSVTGTTFNNNTSKGMYFENLDTATFTNVTVNNSGTSGTWAAGVDINLKYHAFQDIAFTSCTITNCGTGDPLNGAGLTIKARDDGAYSANPATLDNVLITDSLISGCQEGIRFGEPGKDNAGPTNVAVHNCTIHTNVLNGIRNVSLALTNAEDNSWGFGEGPLDATGTHEVSVDDCGATVAEMLNIAPAGALGNAVSGNVDYCPWLTDARLTLRPLDGRTCYQPGDTLTVEVYLSDVDTTNNIVGGDFFLTYDKDRLAFAGADPGDDPFVAEVHESVNGTAGTLDYGVGVTLGNPGTQAGTVMARITFTVRTGADACELADLVAFRVNDPPTKLSDYYAGAVYPALIDLAALAIDGTVPEITGTVGGGNLDANCAAVVPVSITVTDNCGVLLGDVSFTMATSSGTLDYNTSVTATQTNLQTVTISGNAVLTGVTDCSATVSINVGAYDCRDNHGSGTLTGTWTDTTNPTFVDFPANRTQSADPGLCTAVLVPAIKPPTGDDCHGPVTIEYKRSDLANWNEGLTDPYPVGLTTITWKATDACTNGLTQDQTVTIDGVNDIVVSIDIDALLAGPVSRCITFEVWDCSVPAKEIVPTVVDFTPAGSFATGTTTIQVPCDATYTCITARDKLHSLRRRVMLATAGSPPQYVAAFTNTAGEKLLSGNLNDDAWVDILDYGAFSWQYTANPAPSADTDCSTPYPHADLTGDGAVNSGDFTPIFTNYLKGRDANCCSLPGFREDESAPVTRISVAELYEQGLGELAVGDLTGDGWLDEEDMAAFASGTGPAVQIGDLNCDGVVNFGDINPFVQALTSSTTWTETYPGCNVLNADVNEDGVVNFADINLFVALLSNP